MHNLLSSIVFSLLPTLNGCNDEAMTMTNKKREHPVTGALLIALQLLQLQLY